MEIEVFQVDRITIPDIGKCKNFNKQRFLSFSFEHLEGHEDLGRYSTLFRALSCCRNIVVIEIKDVLVRSNVITKIFNAISQNSGIHELVLYNCILKDATLTTLINSQSALKLKRMELRKCSFFDHVDRTNVPETDLNDVFNAFKANDSLEELVIDQVDGSPIVDSILHGLTCHPKLNLLDVSIRSHTLHRVVWPIGNILMSKPSSLTTLELCGFVFHVATTRFDPISSGILACCSLRRLSLQYCHFFDSASTELFEKVFQNERCTVQILELSSDVVFFGKPRVSVATTILEYHNCSLTELSVAIAEPTQATTSPRAFERFLKAIRDRESGAGTDSCLSSLSLRSIDAENDHGEDTVMEILMQNIPKFTKLKKLAFNYDNPDDDYVLNAIKKFLSAIRQNSSFEDVDVDITYWNDLSDVQLELYLQRNKFLQNRSEISLAVYPILFEVMSDFETTGPSMVFEALLERM